MSLDADKVLEDVGYEKPVKKDKVSSTEETKTISGECVKVDWKTTRIINKEKKIQKEEDQNAIGC